MPTTETPPEAFSASDAVREKLEEIESLAHIVQLSVVQLPELLNEGRFDVVKELLRVEWSAQRKSGDAYVGGILPGEIDATAGELRLVVESGDQASKNLAVSIAKALADEAFAQLSRAEREFEDLVRTGEQHAEQIVQAVADELDRRGTPDAEMLRRVARTREAVRDVDRNLEVLQRYFTAGGEVDDG
jgi:hypothetical protein